MNFNILSAGSTIVFRSHRKNSILNSSSGEVNGPPLGTASTASWERPPSWVKRAGVHFSRISICGLRTANVEFQLQPNGVEISSSLFTW